MILLLGCTAPPVLTATLSETDPHAAVLTLDGAGTVDCSALDDVHRLAVDGSAVARGLLANARYNCVATVDGRESDPVFVDTPRLPGDLPIGRVVKEADPADVGFHLVNIARENSQEVAAKKGLSTEMYLAVYDAEGQVR